MGSPLSFFSGRADRWRRRARQGVFVSAAVVLAGPLTGPVAGSEPLRLGAVHFAASGAGEAQPHFQRGVAALHSFWYEEAVEAFHRALAIDPNFAMAWWGVAMAYHRPYLSGSDDTAGRRALAQIGDTSRLTRREVAYIDALRACYSNQASADRTIAYAAAMEKVYHDHPDDPDAAAFYSLSLLGYHWSTEEGFARQERAAAVALEVYRRHPNHPGAAHYIIHSFDDPALAARGLEAARHYARIAPDAPHALHMPSHIFLQLGMWPEAAASNDAGWTASENWVRRKQLHPSRRDYHNFHWLIYACLQQGRYTEAAELVRAFREMRDLIAPEDRHFLHDAMAAYVVETRRWDQADALFAFGTADSTTTSVNPTPSVELCGGTPAGRDPATNPSADVPRFIRALAAAARGTPDAEERLDVLRKGATVRNVMARFWRVRILSVTAQWRTGRRDIDGAIAAAREAVTLEETFGPPPGPPSSAKPPHELFGEILLVAGRPAEARAQFNKTLERHPNRALALLGRARAEAADRQTAAAVASYQRFLEIWHEADADRPELREAREFIAVHRTRA